MALPDTVPYIGWSWDDLAFLALAGVMLGAALLTVLGRDIIRSGLWLVLSFAGLAGIYALLGATIMAAAQVLAALPERATVDWRGGSDYLREGASKWLDGWRRRGWRTSGGEPVKNADLWQRLQAPLAARRIRFRPATEADREDLATLARVVKERLDGGGR